MCLRLIVIHIFLGLACVAGPARGDVEIDQQRLQRHVKQQLDRLADRRLQDLVRLDTDRLRIQERRLVWSCLRRRHLTSDERREAVERLETLLGRILRSPDSDTGRAFLSRTDAEQLVQNSTLSIAWQPRLRDLSRSDFEGALSTFLKQQTEAGSQHASHLRQLAKHFDLTADLSYYDEILSWTIKPASGWEDAPKKIPDVIDGFHAAFKEHEDALIALLRQAITDHDVSLLGAPLLDAQEGALLEMTLRASTSELERSHLEYLREEHKEVLTQFRNLLEGVLREHRNEVRDRMSTLARNPSNESVQRLLEFVADLPAPNPWDIQGFEKLVREYPEFMGAEFGYGDIDANTLGVGVARSRFAAATTKGTARRTIDKVTQVRAQSIPVFPFGSNSPYGGGPRLVIDAGGFTGAVVNQLAFSPDGRFLACGGDVVRIWDLDSGELVETLRGQIALGGAGGCMDLAYSPDGKHLLVAVSTFTASLRIYETNDYPHIQDVLAGHDGHIDRIAFSKDGRWLATAGVDSRINIWDWPQRQRVAAFSVENRVDHLSFPGRNADLLVIDVKGKYCYWDVKAASADAPATAVGPSTELAPEPAPAVLLDGDERIRADGQKEYGKQAPLLETVFRTANWPFGGRVHPFAMAADFQEGLFLAGGIGRSGQSYRYWCSLWRQGSNQPQQSFRHSYFVTACALSSDRQWAASADGFGRVHVWSVRDGREKHLFKPEIRAVYSVKLAAGRESLSFGRTPLKRPEWGFNHYGRMDRRFDFATRTLRSAASVEPPATMLQLNGMQLSLRWDGTKHHFDVHRRGRLLSSSPYGGSSRELPLSYAFLRGTAAGFENGVMIGGEGGTFSVLHPNDLLPRRTFVGHTDRVWCVSESPDGRLLASGSGDGMIRLWNLKNIRNWGGLAALSDENGRIYHVTPNTPTAAAGLRVGDVVLRMGEFIETDEIMHLFGGWTLGELAGELARNKWPFTEGEKVDVAFRRGDKVRVTKVELSNTGDLAEPQLSLFISDDEQEWVIWTQQGYYDASFGGGKFIGWHVNKGLYDAAEFYPVSQFKDQFYRPDIIDLTLELGDADEAIKRAAVRPPPMPQPPTVQIITPADGTRTGGTQITARADIRSADGQPLREIRVLVNGKAFRARNIERADGVTETERVTDTHWIVQHEVHLREGLNTIAFVAATASATTKPHEVSVFYRPDDEPNPLPDLYVAAIGVSNYQDASLDLQFADDDAEAFARTWRSQQGLLYENVHARVLTNDAATKQGVMDLLGWLLKEPGPEDLVILFISGHGVSDAQGDYHFATYDVKITNLFSTGLPWTAIEHWCLKLPCKSVLFVDTCHGAGVTGAGSTVRNPLMNLTRDEHGVVVYASSGHRELSLELTAIGHGAFTRAILDTFTQPLSDQEGDGALSLTELHRNLRQRVRTLTDNRQTPRFQIPVTIDDFDIYRLPSSEPR